jgi:hypothetical protein
LDTAGSTTSLALLLTIIQKHIVRILLMVPIYAADSWISFRLYLYATYIDVLRDA